ncbi:hypothetical protein J2Z33_001735 [Rubellimicrobium aerolatum]|nr:hypothetical protein [Rubellimicrobium aerolatum]
MATLPLSFGHQIRPTDGRVEHIEQTIGGPA